VQQFDIAATRAGRRVEVSSGRGTIEVTEVTRTGQPVRTARFMATRVVAIVEHPVDDPDRDEAAGGSRRRPGANRGNGPEPPTLL
jgi:hypothetical protein